MCYTYKEKERQDNASRRNIYRNYASCKHRDGKPYKDWQEYYVDQSGLIMIFQSDSKPGKYAVYFFCRQMNTCTHRAVNCKFRMGKFG